MSLSINGIKFNIPVPTLAEPSQAQGLTAVDLVVSGLKEQAWTDDDQPCVEQALFILDNVRNYTAWAVWGEF